MTPIDKGQIRKITHSKPILIFWISPAGEVIEAGGAHHKNPPHGGRTILASRTHRGYLRGRAAVIEGTLHVVVYADVASGLSDKQIQLLGESHQAILRVLESKGVNPNLTREVCFIDDSGRTIDLNPLKLSKATLDLLSSLTLREKKVLQDRFVVKRDTTFEDMGNDFSVTRERIKEIERKALSKSRKTDGSDWAVAASKNARTRKFKSVSESASGLQKALRGLRLSPKELEDLIHRELANSPEYLKLLALDPESRKTEIFAIIHANPLLVFWITPEGAVLDASPFHGENPPNGDWDVLNHPTHKRHLRGRATFIGDRIYIVIYGARELTTPVPRNILNSIARKNPVVKTQKILEAHFINEEGEDLILQ